MNLCVIEDFRKKFLNEWRNVNDEALHISNEIIGQIMRDTHKQKMYFGQTQQLPYKENEDGIKLEFILNNGKTLKLTVLYTIYFIDSKLTKYTNEQLATNCEWDEENNTMTIVSEIVDNRITSDFVESVGHETEHMLEYAYGLEKKEDLYDEMKNVLNEYGINSIEGAVAMSLYYSFKHEQNAFKQQFYVHLQKKEVKNGLMFNFVKALDGFQPFINFENCYDTIYEYYDDERVLKTINRLGYNRKKFFNRIYYSYKRFMNKLLNVYKRWEYENRDKLFKNESIIKYTLKRWERQIKLTEGETFKEKTRNMLENREEGYLL